MKSKELQAFKTLFPLRILCVFLLLFALVASVTISVSAEDSAQSTFDKNYNLAKQKIDDLSKQAEEYTALDTTPTKDISQKVNLVLAEHIKRLVDLQTHKDVHTRDLSATIEATYSRGDAAGQLAWICYYHLADLYKEDSINTLKNQYEEDLSFLETKDDASIINSEASLRCILLNRTAYRKKLEELQLDNDTYEAKKKITAAISKLEDIKSTDPLDEAYTAVYEEGKNQLLLQRGRDALLDEMKQIFKITNSGEEFTSNDRMITFGSELDNADTLAQMNEAARTAIYDLTAISENQSYSFIFINKLNADASDIALKATKNEKTGEFLPLFDKFDINFSRVQTKDRIYALLFEGSDAEDQELKNIEKLFNGNEGKIDGCKTKDELSTEISRAEFFKALHNAAVSTRQKLDIVLAKYDRSSFNQRIDNSFSTASKELAMLYGTSASFVENCNLCVEKTKNTLESILDEAKAERFLLNHKNIITKPKENLKLEDELELRACITAYFNLESDVQSVLTSQIKSVAEKYKSVFYLKIRSLAKNDAFYLDLCESICEEIKKLSIDNIDVFYNNCDLIFKKAQTLNAIVSSYRETVSGSVYEDYTTAEKEALAKLCRDAGGDISEIGISMSEALDSSLNKVLENTTLAISRINEYARVRISARTSSDLEIEKLLTDAKAKISASLDKNEMIDIADSTIYKINRLLTVNEIKERSDKTEYRINEMKFLTSDEKSIACAKVKSLKASALHEASLAENITILTFVWDTFTESLSSILSEANQKDLSVAKENYSAQIDKDTEELSNEIKAMAHLSAERRDELTSSLISVCAKFKSDLPTCANSDGVSSLYTGALQTLNSIKISAASENLDNYKLIISAELDKLKNVKANYSAKNYEKILNIIEKSKENLSNCTSLSACSDLLKSAQNEIDSTNDLLDDAKDHANDELKALINACRIGSELYSAENLKKVEAIYGEACEKIRAYEKISDIGVLNATMTEYVAKIKSVKRDRAYSSSNAANITQQGAQYPLGYDFDHGYWASVYSPEGISFDTVLSVQNADSSVDIKKIQSLLRKATKNGSLTLRSDVSDEQLKLLKKSVVSLALDIKLSEMSSDVKKYTLQMLLPSSLKDENILGVIFVDANNNVEFYSIEQRDMLISLNLSHFSNYFIVSENTIDLTPLLIFLIILLIFELVALCFILYLRRTRKRKEMNMLPENFLYSFAPIGAFALRVKPQNAVSLTLLLSVAALALGCGIAFLAKLELAALKKQKEIKSNTYREPEEEGEIKLLHTSEIPRLKEKSYYIEEAQRETVFCSVATEYSQNSADEDIQAFIYEEDAPEDAEDSDTRFASHRAEINLDVIADNFRSGELVTLEALKKKKLVSRKTDYIKILARGSLTKPLIIEAHDFSRAAEKMLVAVGGEAIRIK